MGEVSAQSHRHGTPWLEYAYSPALLPTLSPWRPSMWRYRTLLPLGNGPIRYPMPVGGTPLLRVPRLRAELGMPRLWIKDETTGLTGSNKDRATALVIEDGLRRGIGTITTASTGNAAVSTAFGAAAAGLRAVIFVSTACRPDKLTLMLHAGAAVFQVRRGYAAAMATIKQNQQSALPLPPDRKVLEIVIELTIGNVRHER
jgi:threonine synthase